MPGVERRNTLEARQKQEHAVSTYFFLNKIDQLPKNAFLLVIASDTSHMKPPRVSFALNIEMLETSQIVSFE
jgi:translation elongation factor EF-G